MGIFKDLRLSGIPGMATLMDRILLIFLLFFTCALFLFSKQLFPSGNSVTVSLNNQPVYALSLNEDVVVSVKGVLGENLVEIRNGKVRMKDAPCTNKLCVHQGWIDRGAIVCLPNKVTVTAGGDGERTDKYDAVSK
ncbi:MAG: NusG domain II-containing protein [Nitrospirae bacterium]|nr:NusG domain II-containing protein [Nitrospirota bacterium]